MKNQKWYKISIFVIVCILLNYAGKIAATEMELPLWLDSFGTVLAAYVLGPVCGAIVGVSMNIMYGLQVSCVQMIYGMNSIMLGICVGLSAKRGHMKYLFGMLSTSFVITVLSVLLSTPLNYLFFDGDIGNVWGNGISELLQNMGCNRFVGNVIGEFYIEFLDKVVMLFVLFIVLKVHERGQKRLSEKKKAILMLSALLIFTAVCPTEKLYAAQETGAAAQKTGAAAARETEAADYNTYVQTIYNGDDGLSGGMANDIAQTQDGILWIGTYSGLYRYNGSSFQLMDKFETVKNANCLYTDEAGRLWIGTNDSGLSICINETISNVVSREDGLASDSVRCIVQSSEGNYYVGTSGGLSILSLSSGLSVSATIQEIVYANSISADQQGNVAVATSDGTLYLVRDSVIVDKITGEDNEGYTSCIFDAAGNLYAGTESNRIDYYSVSEGKMQLLSARSCEGLSNICSLTCIEDGTLFVCADNGVGCFDGEEQFHMINTGSFNNSIDHMLMDYQGNLWFTSSRLGLLRLCSSVFSEVYSNMGLEENVVNTVTEWQDCLYFGRDNGLDIIDAAGQVKTEEELSSLLSGCRIRCLEVDSASHLWICTSGKGIFEVAENGTITAYNSRNGALGDKFRSVLELTDGTIAAAGDYGITFINEGKVTRTIGSSDGLKNSKILCMLEREDGSILAGTDGDGIAVLKDGKLTDMLQKEDGLGSEVILRMVKEKDGDGIFLVTSNSISYMEKDGTIRGLDNFPYYNNYDLVEGENGTVFVLGSAGIFVVDKEELLSGEKLDYELLNSKKGLQKSLTPNSWNYVDAQGNLYLSADTGVVCINLNEYDFAVRSYRMMLKSIKADGISYPVERGEEIVLPREVSRIEILPEVVNYSLNDPYVSIWLEGIEQEPKVMLQSEITPVVYTNLPTGQYIFHLAILDNKGKKAIAESTYTFQKEKEIYDNWWFMVYAVFVFALAVSYLTWLFFRTQIQKTLNMQKRELELTRKQVEMGNEAILTIAKTVDAKDENTSQHSVRVSEYSVMIAKRLGFSEEACEELKRTALLHDIGKIGIPDRVLNKPSRLTDEEYKLMKSHVVKGAAILKNFTLLKHVEEGALYHHERYDGTGYVHGLKGEEIPLNARIIGIADAFDAMTANRVYRNKLDMDFVVEELKRGRGTQFDPKLVDIMLELIADGTINVRQLYETANTRTMV